MIGNHHQQENWLTDRLMSQQIVKDRLNSHFGQSVHALEDIFGQRLKVVVSQTPNQEKRREKCTSDWIRGPQTVLFTEWVITLYHSVLLSDLSKTRMNKYQAEYKQPNVREAQVRIQTPWQYLWDKRLSGEREGN